MNLTINQKRILLSLLSATFFVALFYRKDWGTNLFIFQILSIGGITYLFKPSFTKRQKFFLLAAILTVVFALIHHSLLAFFISILTVTIYGSSLLDHKFQSVHLIFTNMVRNSIRSYFAWTKALFNFLPANTRTKSVMKKALLFIVPLLVLAVFFLMYAAGNPSFGSALVFFIDGFEWLYNTFWEHLNLIMFFTFMAGLLVSIPFYFLNVSDYFLKQEMDDGILRRVKTKSGGFRITGLRLELQLAEFTMIGLNIMLALLLVFEIKDVWFGFEWNGQYLKSFVHEGMHVLLCTIIISMAVSLYLFRGNQNFYSKSFRLKKLTFWWLGLNAILVLSVAIRDFYYIYYFALAYMRIVLLFCLAATTIGLWSVYTKVKHTKNGTYLWRINSLSIFILLVISTFFNWDTIIAKYNFSNKERAFVHLDYLSELSNAALPYLRVDSLELNKVEIVQRKRLGESRSSYSRKYISADNYAEHLEYRINRFTDRWEKQHWLEWNLAESKAYHKLKKENQ
ncbi:DUF4173 domain-containing protein [Cryomorphaceae bacterium 1068]|nr:DUF4173 domain-containing protein [Cryomorphaceae bacterium 1068]